MQRARLKWFGHVEWKEENDWVKKCTRMNVTGMVAEVLRGKHGGVVSRGQEGHESYEYKKGNGAGPLCLEEYYWRSDPC